MSEEAIKVPLFVEVIGEAAAGKTHLSCIFSKPAVLDTTPKKESYVILRKLYPDWKRRHHPIRSLEDVRTALKFIKTAPNDFKTVVVDTSADLRDLASKEYLDEKRKAGKERESVMPREYKWVNEKVDAIIDEVQSELKLNLVFISQMKDEWVGDKSTGRRIRRGYPSANFQADIRLFLQIENKVDEKTMKVIPNRYKRTCRVIKNRFRDQTNEEEWIPVLKELNWKGIVELSKLEESEVVE